MNNVQPTSLPASIKTLDSSLQGTCFITTVYSSHLLLLHRDKDTRIEKYYFE